MFGLPTDGKSTLKPIVLSRKTKKYDSTQTIVEESSEDIDKLRVQLEQEDCRGEAGDSRLRRGMRKISTSSKNLLHKRKHVFGKKSKRDCPPIDNEEDTSSLMGSAQEIYRVSPSNSLRNSLTDIRGKLKILNQKPKYQRASSDGVAMAALLVRSMMAAPTALDCIDEANDSPKSSVKSQDGIMSQQKSGSMSNLSGTAERNIYLKPTMAYTAAHLKISDSNLSSTFSESSCTISSVSSANGDEDCSESEETTTQNDILLVDADTVSMVVKSVLAHEQSERNKDDWIEPKTLELRARCADEIRMSKPAKGDCTDGEMDADMLKALMISPNEDEDSANWIQPGSTADEPECLPEKRRGSVFHELKENISEKIHHLQEHIHFPHLHMSSTEAQHHEVKNRHGLLATALDTILIEQASILGAALPTVQQAAAAAAVQPSDTQEKPDLTTKRRSSIDAIKKFTHSFQKRLSVSEKSTKAATTVATQTDEPELQQRRESASCTTTKEYVLSAPFLSLTDLEQIDANEINKMSYGSAVEFGSIKEAAPSFISLTDLYTGHDLDSNSTSCVSIVVQPQQTQQQIFPPQSSNQSSNLTTLPLPVSESNFSCVISSPTIELIKSTAATTTTTTSVTMTSNNNNDNNDDNDARCCDLLSITNKAFLLTPVPNPNHHRSEAAVASPNTKLGGAVNVSGHTRAESAGGKMSQSPAKNNGNALTTSQTTPTTAKEPVCRRSSDSDLNVTPKGKHFDS